MADKSINILFPVGRLVGGSVYEAQPVTDNNGNAKLIKTGDKAGQPLKMFYIPIAIPKEPGHTHWAQTEWGRKIWDFAHAQWPQGQAQRADFAWKITDGDSTVPNKKGKRPCDQPGHAGHWVLKFGGSVAPKLVNADGSAALLEPDAILPGYFVQMYGSVSSNNSDQTAGLYLNHGIVARAAYGEVIVFGPDPSSVGFGQGAALPAGASAVPLAAMTPAAASGALPPPPGAPSPATASPPVPGVPAAGSVTPPPPVPAAAAPVAAAAPPVPVPTPAPSQTFTAQATTPPPPPAAVAPPPAAGPQRLMTAAAGGVSYEAHIAAGWTDETLIQHGRMVIQ